LNATEDASASRHAGSDTSADKNIRTSSATGEFNAHANPSANTAPHQQPGPVSSSIDAAKHTSTNSANDETANEEFRGPKSADANSEVTAEELKGPLPDLRQGIPSTFDMEYGQRKPARGQEDGQEQGQDGTTKAGESEYQGGSNYDPSEYQTSVDKARAKLLRWTYTTLAVFLLTGTAYFGRPIEEDEEAPNGVSPSDLVRNPMAIWARIKCRTSGSVQYYKEPVGKVLLPPRNPNVPQYTLVLGLEDLLVHSEWSREKGWQTAKRPGVDYFLQYMSAYYEIVIFSALPQFLTEQIYRKLDPYQITGMFLWRDHTRYEDGKYIKDLSYLGRPLDTTIIVDSNLDHVRMQQENAVVLTPWTGPASGQQANDLVALIPFLEYVAGLQHPDVRKAIGLSFLIQTEFSEREADFFVESFKGAYIPEEWARREAKLRSQTAPNANTPRKSLGGVLTSALGMQSVNPMGAMPGPGQHNSGTILQVDQLREHGTENYLRMKKAIEENGEQWLKETREQEQQMQKAFMEETRNSWFGGMFGKPSAPASAPIDPTTTSTSVTK